VSSTAESSAPASGRPNPFDDKQDNSTLSARARAAPPPPTETQVQAPTQAASSRASREPKPSEAQIVVASTRGNVDAAAAGKDSVVTNGYYEAEAPEAAPAPSAPTVTLGRGGREIIEFSDPVQYEPCFAKPKASQSDSHKVDLVKGHWKDVIDSTRQDTMMHPDALSRDNHFNDTDNPAPIQDPLSRDGSIPSQWAKSLKKDLADDDLSGMLLGSIIEGRTGQGLHRDDHH